MAALGITEEMLEGRVVYKAVGCKECRFEGYRGRKGLFEMFDMDARMRDLTFNGASTHELRAQGTRLLRDDHPARGWRAQDPVGAYLGRRGAPRHRQRIGDLKCT